MVLVKNYQLIFLYFYFRQKMTENVFDNILERENTFVPNKNNKFLRKNKLVLFKRG